VCYCIIGSCTYYRHEATPTRSSSSSSSDLRFIHTTSHPFFSLSGEGRRVEARRRASGIPSDATGLRARRRSSYGRVELPVPPSTGDHTQPPPLRHDRRSRGSAGGAAEPPEATAATPAGHQPRRAASTCTRARRPSRRPRPFSWNRLFSGSVSRSTRGQERSE